MAAQSPSREVLRNYASETVDREEQGLLPFQLPEGISRRSKGVYEALVIQERNLRASIRRRAPRAPPPSPRTPRRHPITQKLYDFFSKPKSSGKNKRKGTRRR